MKNIIKNCLVLFVLALGIYSCNTNEAITDDVQNDVTAGAVLRTIKVLNATYDFNDDASEFKVEVQEQDVEDGALLSEVRVLVQFNDKSPGNGTITTTETQVGTFPASVFTIDELGLPRVIITSSFGEAKTALGLTNNDIDVADTFSVSLELVLTDGRVFGRNDIGSSVTGGFFASPFNYSVQFFCLLSDASLFEGDYEVTQDDWADYNTGDIITVVFNQGFKFKLLSTANPFIDNTSTSYMEFTLDPEGNATVQTNECLQYTGWRCLDVTATGSVGTCTGDINVVLKLVDPNDGATWSSQVFNLIKL